MEAPLEETCSQAEPGSASCVQRFDDSLNSAIRTTYRISLRSSSLREPRYPSTRVVCCDNSSGGRTGATRETHARTAPWRQGKGHATRTTRTRAARRSSGGHATAGSRGGQTAAGRASSACATTPRTEADADAQRTRSDNETVRARKTETVRKGAGGKTGNDPSAGSPTETLLRLLLPLNDKVCASSQSVRVANHYRCLSPKSSPDHSIGRSDGRCVQRAGT